MMKTQFVSAGGMILSAPGTTTGLVTGHLATTQQSDSRAYSKPRRLIGPLLAAAVTLQAAVVLGGPPAYTFKPIVFLGDQAPGGGAFVNDYEPSAINNRGEFAFTADLIEDGQEGIFLGRAGAALSQVVRFGQVAPGTRGGLFGASEMGNLGLNDEGDLAFGFTLDPLQFYFDWFTGAYGGVWRYSHETQKVTPVVVPGDPVPGPGGRTFQGVGLDLSMNNHGTIAFEALLSLDPTAGVFLANKDGTISPLALPGDPAPNGDTWEGAVNPSINGAGDVAFCALTSRAKEAGRGPSIYLSKAATGEILTIANAGDPAPGGGVLLNAFQPKINDRGDVVFTSDLSLGDNNPAGSTSGVYLHTGGTLLRVAGPGDLMPGGGHLVFVSGYDWNVGLNNSGTVAFTAALDNGDEGLYAYSHGSLRLIAKTGTVIPGLGTIYSLEMGNSNIPGIPPTPTGYPNGAGQLNDRGQTVFGCSLTDGRVVLLLATPNGVK